MKTLVPNFVFFGSPEFAAVILEKIIQNGFRPSLVVCNPDKPTGRKKNITSPPVKTGIMNQESRIKNVIKILQPEKLDKEFRDSLFIIHDSYDFFIVAAYAKIIPPEILEIPKFGSIGVHPSLLPKYRGATPIQSAILNDDEQTGVTLFLIDEKVDHGPIIAQKELRGEELKTMDCKQLSKKLADLGGNLLIETLPKFLAGEIELEPQNESQAAYTKKIKTEDGFIEEGGLERAENGRDLEQAKIILRKIRALNPEPGVYTFKNGKRTKILEAEIVDGKLRIKRIHVEGKPRSETLP